MMANTLKYRIALFITLLFSASLTQLWADENKPLLDKNKISIGAGLSSNSIGGPVSDEIGFQFFAAYDLSQFNVMEGVNSSVEIGFMDYGFARDSTGIWATYVVDGAIGEQLGWLARLGLDIGDDSGLMIGAGASYAIDEKMQFRGEYVIRDDVNSLQFNLLYRL